MAKAIQKPAAIALCRELGLGDRLFPTTEPRQAFILRSGDTAPTSAANGVATKVIGLISKSASGMPGAWLIVEPAYWLARSPAVSSTPEPLAKPIVAGAVSS